MVVTIYLDTGSSDEECDDDDVIMVVHPDSDPLRSVDLVELEPVLRVVTARNHQILRAM